MYTDTYGVSPLLMDARRMWAPTGVARVSVREFSFLKFSSVFVLVWQAGLVPQPALQQSEHTWKETCGWHSERERR